MRAWLSAAVLSGAPSTLAAVVRRDDPLASTRVIGRLVLPREQHGWRLVVVGGAVHVAISLGWTAVIRTAITRETAAVDRVQRGALAGAAIAVLDLGLIGRRFALVRELNAVEQVADHLVFGALAAL